MWGGNCRLTARLWSAFELNNYRLLSFDIVPSCFLVIIFYFDLSNCIEKMVALVIDSILQEEKTFIVVVVL